MGLNSVRGKEFKYGHVQSILNKGLIRKKRLEDIAQEKRTTIIISHRISAIQNADLILVLEDGKLTEKGTHQMLINNKGFYYDIFQKQNKKES